MIAEILLRIDVRNLTKELIIGVVKFVEDNEAMLFYDYSFYTINELAPLIRSSEASKFYTNPLL